MIYFYDEVKKQDLNYLDVTRKMRAFIDKNEPKLASILMRFWTAQENVLTYKELREAVLAGFLTEALFQEWSNDYANLINEYFVPVWLLAAADAVQELERKYPVYSYDPARAGVKAWTEQHAADLVTQLSDQQRKAMNGLITRTAVMGTESVDQLSRLIRPLIGLTAPQASAVMKYYDTIRENGISPKRARESAIRMAQRKHRERAMTVAVNELAVAYRAGTRYGIEDAQNQGFMGKTVKIWLTADDERVCKICRPMDMQEVDFDAPFITPDGKQIWDARGAHIRCRCAIAYREVAPPILQ